MPTLLLLRNYDLSEEEVQKLPSGCRGVLIEKNRSTVIARADVPSYMPFSSVIQLVVAMGRAIPNAQVVYRENTLDKAKWITEPFSSWQYNFVSEQAPLNHKSSSNLEDLPKEEVFTIHKKENFQNQQNQVEEASISDYSVLSKELEDGTKQQIYPTDVVDIEGEDIVDAEFVEEVQSGRKGENTGFLDVDKSDTKSSDKRELTWWELLDAGLVRQAYDEITTITLSSEERRKLSFYLSSKDPNVLIFLCRVAIAIDWKSSVLPMSRKCFIHEHPQVRKEAVLAVGQLAGPSMESAIRRLIKDSDAQVQEAANQALEFLKSR